MWATVSLEDFFPQPHIRKYLTTPHNTFLTKYFSDDVEFDVKFDVEFVAQFDVEFDVRFDVAFDVEIDVKFVVKFDIVTTIQSFWRGFGEVSGLGKVSAKFRPKCIPAGLNGSEWVRTGRKFQKTCENVEKSRENVEKAHGQIYKNFFLQRSRLA